MKNVWRRLGRRKTTAAAIFASLLLLTVVVVTLSHSQATAQHSPLAHNQPVVVSTAVARSGSLHQPVPVEGSVVAVNSLAVTSSQSGQVQTISAHVGETVSAGQNLVELADTQGLGQQLATAQAALAADSASLQSLQDPAASVNPAAVHEAQARVAQAQAALNQAQLKARSDAQTAALAASVTSPINGIIQTTDVANNQTVAAGSPIAQISPAGEPAQINAQIPLSQASALTIGATATVSVLGSSATVQGSVSSISASGAGASATATGASATGGASASSGGQTVVVAVRASGPDVLMAGSVATVSIGLPSGGTAQGFGPVTYPQTVTLAAQAPGTISSLQPKGTSIAIGQPVAALTDPAASQLAAQDQAAVQAAQASVFSAQAALSAVQTPPAGTSAAVAAMQAKIAADRQAVAHAQADVSALNVTAPFAGVISQRMISPGQMVTPATPLLDLVGTTVTVHASVSPSDVASLKAAIGATANIELSSASPSPPVPATLTAVYPAADPSSQLFTVVLTPTSSAPPGALSVGEPVSATVQAGATSGVVIPSAAITYPNGSPAVFTVATGTAHLRPVTVGLLSGGFAVLQSGLSPGETVVTQGQSFLASGDAVRVAATKAASS